MSKHNEVVYLRHMVEAADKVGELVSRGGKKLFLEDFAIADAIVRELMVIGEAARGLSADFRLAQSYVPWKDIVGMRDWLVHGYAEVDWERVWNTAVGDVPGLKDKIKRILELEEG